MFAILWLSLLLCRASAYATHNKFKHWYPYYRGVLENEILGIGGHPYNNCSANVSAYDTTIRGVDATSRCYNVYDCLYSGLLPNEQSNFASAQVILGLTPTLLATLAPSINEVSLLSSERPLLSLIISLGGPAVNVPRLLGYNTPTLNLEENSTFLPTFFYEPSGSTTIIILCAQYVLAIGAMANVIQVSWQLGIRTVVAWKCNSSYLPFLWSTLPCIIHVIGVLGWRLSRSMRARQNNLRPLTSRQWYRLDRYLLPGLGTEFSLSSSHDYMFILTGNENPVPKRLENRWSVFWSQTAEFIAFLHVLFGTLVFSSLMFIATLDSMVIILRYIVSGFICRLLLLIELHGMCVSKRRAEVANSSSHSLGNTTR